MMGGAVGPPSGLAAAFGSGKKDPAPIMAASSLRTIQPRIYFRLREISYWHAVQNLAG